MKDNALRRVTAFLRKECSVHAPLLLGLSGGSDSMCLLHMLLEYRKANPLELHLVHVDHGWREESARECIELSKRAEEYNCPFHFIRLDPTMFQGNLESESRTARLQFFASIQQKTGAQGVLLAHHQGDQAETILKRLFEGAHLTSLSGMQPITHMPNLTLFRPLLDVSKEEILHYIQAHSIQFFDDVTNRDPKFLRARMRLETIPLLERSFGKEFSHHLTQLSQEASLLKEHFTALLRPTIEQGIQGPFGTCYAIKNLSLIECQELLQRLATKHALILSHAAIKRAAQCLHDQEANKWVDNKLYIDRGYLFIIQNSPGKSWQLSTSTSGPILNSWQDVWKGKVATLLPQANYQQEMGASKMRHALTGKQLDHYLTEKKVPRYISTLCPMLISQDAVAEDFLTSSLHKRSEVDLIHIQLEYK